MYFNVTLGLIFQNRVTYHDEVFAAFISLYLLDDVELVTTWF